MEEHVSLRRATLAGAVAILAFAVSSLAFNPIVVDETLGSGAVLAGMPPYPPGHPHVYFYERAFSLGNHMTSWALRLGFERDWISATRNTLALFLALFAPYCAALALTRRWALAAGAAIFAALEAPTAYDGLYPVLVYPDIYSHGQIGQSLAVLVAAAWAGGATRTAALLTGLMPMLHAGVVAPLWIFTLLYLGFSRNRARGPELRRALAGGALGLALNAAFFAWTRWKASPFESIPPYSAPGDDTAARNFVALTDFHRQLPDFTRFGYAVHFIVFAMLAFALLRGGRELGERSNGPAAAARWLVVFAGVAWLFTFGCAAAQALGVLPYPLLMSMPSRVSNLSTILLGPFVVAAVAGAVERVEAPQRGAFWAAVGSLFVAAAVWILQRGPWQVRDQVGVVAFGLAAAAGLWAVRRSRRDFPWICVACAVLAGVLFVLYPQPVRHWSFLGGIGVGLVALTLGGALARSQPVLAHSGAAFALCGGLLAAAVNMPGRWVDFGKNWRCDVPSRFDREMVAWMKANVAPDEPVLTAAWVRLEVQQKTGHPVLAETETLWMLTYMPELGSAVAPLFRDLYEVDYSRARDVLALSGGGRFKLTNPYWSMVWRDRTPERWAELAHKYDFELVVSPEDTQLALPKVVDGNLWDLYRIPRD